MLKHISRFDYTEFAWLLPLEIHTIVGDYCRTGVRLEHMSSTPVDEDVRNVDVARDGRVLLAEDAKWMGMEFHQTINAIQEDCGVIHQNCYCAP